MKYKTKKITFKDGTTVKMTYKKNNILFESLDEITEFHLPYLGMLMIGDSYDMSDQEFKFYLNWSESFIYKMVEGKINMHSPKSKVFLNRNAPLRPGELEDKINKDNGGGDEQK